MDMTPMVDVAFLLLTFFMLTTVFSRPQAMEVNLPDSPEEIKIAESKVMTIRGSEDGNVYWNMGTEPLQRITYGELNAALTRQRGILGDDLIAIIKVDRRGTYTNIVDMLDEIKLAGVTKFSIAPFTAQDSTQVLQTRAGA
ncbi:MAG TPA: biopolymer transporter ExbD [Rubricoccaceae bacterium]